MMKIVFLVVPDESEFSHKVPLVIGTCMISCIINVIQESEIDCLSTPWATVRMMQLLSCWKSTAVLTLGSVEAQSEGASRGSQEVDVDELVMVRESVHLGPFQTKIIEGWVKPLLGDMAHIMVTLLKVGEDQLRDSRPLCKQPFFCKLPFSHKLLLACFLVPSCPKRALVWGMVVRGFAHRDLC